MTRYDCLQEMNVLINLVEGLDRPRAEKILGALQIPNVHFDSEGQTAFCESQTGTYRLNVKSVSAHQDSREFSEIVQDSAFSALLINPGAADLIEPRVIYATDNSARAERQLERFKQLRPTGFHGAIVVSDNETLLSRSVWQEVNNQFLCALKSALQTSNANLVIANYDHTRSCHMSAKLAELSATFHCHMLILKS